MRLAAIRTTRRIAIAAAALLVAAFAVGALTGDRGRPSGLAETGGPTRHIAGPRSEPMPAPGVAEDGLSGTAGGSDAAVGVAQTALPPLGDRIVREASIAVEIADGSFDRVWNRAFTIARRFDGSVLTASRGSNGPVPLEDSGSDADQSGDIVIRVPAERFEAATNELRGLGEVRGDTVSAQDVTQEFIDLRSRLRHLRAQEDVLLRLMRRARSVEDTIAVQGRLSDVQLQIEEITGRLEFLENRTELSTINLHLAEPGAIAGGDGEPSFAKAWDTAVEGLVRMGTAAMILAAWATPFVLLGLGILAGRRLLRRPAPQP